MPVSLCPQVDGPVVGFPESHFTCFIRQNGRWYFWECGHILRVPQDSKAPEISTTKLCHHAREIGMLLTSLLLVTKQSCKVNFPYVDTPQLSYFWGDSGPDRTY